MISPERIFLVQITAVNAHRHPVNHGIHKRVVNVAEHPGPLHKKRISVILIPVISVRPEILFFSAAQLYHVVSHTVADPSCHLLPAAPSLVK